MAVAAGADVDRLYSIRRQTGLEQLAPTYRPEIEIVRPNLEGMHPGWQFPAEMDKFGAAGTK